MAAGFIAVAGASLCAMENRTAAVEMRPFRIPGAFEIACPAITFWYESPNETNDSANPSSCDDVAIVACLEWRIFAFRSRIYCKTGEPSDAIFAILYPSSWHHMSTSQRIDSRI